MKHTSLNATTFVAVSNKCGFDDILCEDNDKTCVIVRETMEMSAKHVYMMKKPHFHIYYPLKQTETPLFMISVNDS